MTLFYIPFIFELYLVVHTFELLFVVIPYTADDTISTGWKQSTAKVPQSQSLLEPITVLLKHSAKETTCITFSDLISIMLHYISTYLPCFWVIPSHPIIVLHTLLLLTYTIDTFLVCRKTLAYHKSSLSIPLSILIKDS